jgi:hypothetical protein
MSVEAIVVIVLLIIDAALIICGPVTMLGNYHAWRWGSGG